MADIFQKCLNKKTAYFNEIQDKVTVYRHLPTLEGPVGPRMRYGEKEVIVWSYNDYLGLTNHPVCRESEMSSVHKYSGNTVMGSRSIAANHPDYLQLETTLSEFIHYEDTLLFATGYLAAIGTIPALVGVGDYILLDSAGHACLFDAVKIAQANGAKLRVFKHNDMEDLAAQLEHIRKTENDAGILIVCDGVYSMTGDVADLPALVKLKKQYDARLFVDDAHGTGVMGENGSGTVNYFNAEQDVDLVMHVFSKAFASIGASVSGSKEMIDYLRCNAKTYIFSHCMQLVFVNRILTTLDLIKNQPNIITKLWDNKSILQEKLKTNGFNIGTTRSPITPVIFKVTDFKSDMNALISLILFLREEYSVYTSPIIYPAVPSNMMLIRLIPTTNHSFDDIETTVKGLVEGVKVCKLASN